METPQSPTLAELIDATQPDAENKRAERTIKVLTIRVPLSLRSALGVVAARQRTSINKLAVVAMYHAAASLADTDAAREDLKRAAETLFPNMKGTANHASEPPRDR